MKTIYKPNMELRNLIEGLSYIPREVTIKKPLKKGKEK